MNTLSTYLKEAYRELQKVTWPSKKQTANYSLIVIAITLGVAVFFAGLDYFLNLLLGLVL